MKNLFKKFPGQTTILKVTRSICVSALCLSLCIVLLQSFKSVPPPIPGGMNCPLVSENETLRNQEEVKKMYKNFKDKYGAANFNQYGGSLSKAVICNLLSKMQDPNDTLVYYLFGRNDTGENLIMLFNNPRQSPLETSPKFHSAPPYCPPTCSTELMNYVN